MSCKPNPRFRSIGIGSLLILMLFMVPSILFARSSSAAMPVASARQDDQEKYELRVSSFSDRSRNIPLADKGVVSGNIRVFVTPPVGVERVRFYLDHPEELLEDPLVAGEPYTVANQPPFDLAGSESNGGAKPFDTSQLTDGEHSIVAAVDLKDGTTAVRIARFIVHNGPPAIRFGPQPLKFKVVEGGRASKTMKLFVGNAAPTMATLAESSSWLTLESPTPGGNGRKAAAPGLHTLSVDAAGLDPGTYTSTVTASSDGYTSDSLTVTMEVTAESTESTCSPLACEEILVTLPYTLTFDTDHGKILDANSFGTGFTYVDQPTNGSGYIPSNLIVDTAAPGTYNVNTTKGINYEAVNSQDNALGVGIDAPSQITVMETTLIDPPAGSGNFEQGGLWFGNDEDNYVKLEVISTPDGTRIEYLMEVTGARADSKVTGVLNLAGATVDLSLRANPTDRSISAYYALNGGALTKLDSFIAPSEFFSFDAAGIDPTIGTRSFGGVFATHRNGTTPLTYTFDNFFVTSGAAAPPSGEVSFDRTSYSVPYPTSMVWGPDDRLYVTELYGTIHALTLDDAKQVVADEVITTLGTRLTLGITVDPLSTPDNVILWVSHSSPSTDNGELNSSTVTRLSGSGFATKEDVITGLPRAIANHAVNSIHFGPDGLLYIALGGNTGAGAPNEANTEFGTRAEQPLSAALLVADVYATEFDGTCATPENTYGPSPCDVQVYASGLRNMYDFVWHSNGYLYAPDNGLGVTGTYPPTPSPPCEGYGDTALWTEGGDNPGEQPDIFVRLEQGKYYGHPDPYREECVFKDGSYQGVAPLANYVPAIYALGKNKSANGTIEYKSNAFNGALKGEILIANYSVGDDITRIRLSDDGLSVVEAKQLVGGFSNPLPVTEGPDGTIYVGEFGGSLVTALVPKALGTWTTQQSMPVELLDAGGTALDGKLYLVAGKTSAGYQTSLYIYDPATNSWTAGPDLPADYPGVENPAVAAYNGKLYVFGGSTDPFSAAVTNAAVYDPATSSWTVLAPMQTGRGGATAQTINDKIYVAGGMDVNGASLASVEVYDPTSNTWSSAAPMASRRDNPGSAVLNGMLYIFGGRTRDADGTEVDGTLATVESYDPATDTWTARASMPTGRRTLVVGTIDGKAQVMGGERTSSGGSFEQNEEYDPATDTWRTLTPMLTARHGAAAATINGVVYVASGGPTGGSSYSSTNEAFEFVASGTAPETTIDSGPSGTINSSSASFTFSSSETGSTFECSLDGVAFSACNSPTEYTALAEGDHIFQVRAIDADGNVDDTPASRTWTIDLTAPTVASVAPADGAVDVAVSANVEATFSEAMDPASVTTTTFTLLNQSTLTTVSGSVTYDSTSSKAILDPDVDLDSATSYTATVKGGTTGVTDLAGNTLAQDFVWSFTTVNTADTTPPETTIDSGPSGTVNSSSASFTFSSSETGSTFECSLDGAAFNACTSPQDYTGLVDGDHTFQVRAIDAAGNVDDTPASRTWTIDTTPPTVVSVAPVDGAVDIAVGTNVGASFSEAIDPASLTTTSFTLVNQKTLTAVSAAVSYDATNNTAILNPDVDLEPGTSYTATVKGGTGGVTDIAGNALAQDFVWSFTTADTADTTPPETTIDSGPSGTVNSSTASFTFSSSETGSTFECSLDGAAFSACTSPQDYTGLADGDHTFHVRATDEAGNTDPTPASRTWTVDTTAPETTIDSGPSGTVNSSSASFTFSSDETGSSFECSLDGATFSSCTSPQDYTGLAEGSHTFHVRAIDAAGNTDSTPASRTWTVDTTAPDTTIDSGPSGTVNSSDATFAFSSSEPNSTFECSLNGAAFSACTSPQDYSGLADGDHTFQVRATDTAGNTDLTPASRTWTVDTTAPTVISVAPVDGAVDVAVSVNVEAAFSEELDPASLTATTFTLVNQSTLTAVSAAVTYDATNNTAILDPDVDLEPGTSYTATVKGGTGGVTDVAGNALAQDFVWSFTTGDILSVTSITPNSVQAGGTVDVTISGSAFAPGATVTFENGSGPAPEAVVTSVSSDGTTITATITTKSGGPPRTRDWDVRVTNPSGTSAVLPQAFTVMP